jgi:hypothetical protein
MRGRLKVLRQRLPAFLTASPRSPFTGPSVAEATANPDCNSITVIGIITITCLKIARLRVPAPPRHLHPVGVLADIYWKSSKRVFYFLPQNRYSIF